MWVALLIIALFSWLFKGRRSKSKQQPSKPVLVFLILVIAAGISKAQNDEISISGNIITTSQGQGKIIVFLVDKTAFKTPLTGIDTLVLDSSNKTVPFKFKPHKKGIYGIRCYHDLNNNGYLDKTMFLPAEPYGFSWKSGKTFPFGFSDISFDVDSNMFITINMEG